jgi:hypothetical protein
MYLVQHESFHNSWRAGLLRIGSCLEMKASKNLGLGLGGVLFQHHYVLDHKESTHQTVIINNKTSAAGQLCA